MLTPKTMTYDVTGKIARITLNRPARGNGITLELPQELAACVERANLDPAVHVIALSGNGKGFCGGYDLVASAEHDVTGEEMVDSAKSCANITAIKILKVAEIRTDETSWSFRQ